MVTHNQLVRDLWVADGMVAWRPKKDAKFNYGVPASEVEDFEVIRKPHQRLYGFVAFVNVCCLLLQALLPTPLLPGWLTIGLPLIASLAACGVLIRRPSWHPKQVRLRMRDGTQHEILIKAPLESLIEAKNTVTSYRDTSGEGWLSPTSDGALSMEQA